MAIEKLSYELCVCPVQGFQQCPRAAWGAWIQTAKAQIYL